MKDGKVFYGEWDKYIMIKGKMSYLEAGGKRTIIEETFDYNNDLKNEIFSFEQKPIVSVEE